MLNQDLRKIRTVGLFATASGALLLIFTILTALFIGFVGGGGSFTDFTQGLMALILSLVVASTLLGCGAHFMQQKHFVTSSVELRLNWTALVVIMTASALLYPWLYWPLTALPVIFLLALIAVRGAVIRLTS